MYEDYGAGYLVEFSRLTRRRDAMLQVVQPGCYPEHVWIGGEAIAASLFRALRLGFANLRAVAITPGGTGRLHAVASLAEPRAGDARRLIEAAWEAVRLGKVVRVVDGGGDTWVTLHDGWFVA